MNNKSYLIVGLIFLWINTYSQDWQNPYINYTIKDGLPSNEVYDVIQDSLGYMWFATDNGLCRFDGYGYKTYGKKDGLTDRVVFDLQLDKYGRIWMSSLLKKIFVYQPKGDVIIEMAEINKEINVCTNTKLQFYFYDDADILRVDCNLSYYKYKVNEELIVLKKEFYGSETKLIKNGDLYYHHYVLPYTQDEFKFKFNKNYIVLKSSIYLSDIYFITAAYSLNDSVALLGHNSGSLIFTKENDLIKKKHQRIEDVLINKDGSFIVCYISNGGVHYYSNADDFISDKGKMILDGISASNATFDKQGNLWVTTNNTGVFKIKYNNEIFIKSLTNFTQFSKALKFIDKDQKSLSLFLKNGSYIKIGKFHVKDETDYLLHKSSEISINNVYKFRNKLFFIKETTEIGEYIEGHFVLKKNRCSSGERYLGNKLIFNPFFPVMYSASFNSLRIIDIDKDTCLSYKSSRITDVKQLKNGQLYLTGLAGLSELKKGEIVAVHRNLHAYLNSRIDFIDQLEDSTIVLASKNAGVYFLNKDKIKFFDIVKEYNIDLIKFLEVSGENLWVVTSKSLLVFKVKSGIIVDKSHFRFGIDLPYDQINTLLFEKDLIYVGMDKNLVVIDKKEIFKKSKYSPPPIIERISLNNITLSSKHDLIFDHSENNISLKLLSINHNMDGNVNYKYSINNEKYINIDDSRLLNFYELGPGKYEFKFIAQNEDGVWSKPTMLTISILNPWWRTWWFYFLCIASSSLISYLFFRQKLLQQKKVEALNNEIRNLEKSALQAQMNPHFIFNSLNSIQKFILANSKEEASEYLSKFASLIRLNLKASNSKKIPLEEEITLLNLYLDMEKLRFKNKFNYEFKVSLTEEESKNITIPPMLIQPIVENSILHGIANTAKLGKIVINIEKNRQDLLTIIVRDNGSGLIERKNTSHISFGSKITKRRLELIGSENQSNFHLKNLLNENGEVIGTEAILNIHLV